MIDDVPTFTTAIASPSGDPLRVLELHGPTRTTSPSRAPARASARSTPIRRRRTCTYSIASSFVRSAIATTRSALRPATRHAPSSSRTTVKPSSTGRSTTNGSSASGSAARASSTSVPETPEEHVEAAARVTADKRDRVGIVQLRRSRRRPCSRPRAAGARAARAGSRSSSSSRTRSCSSGERPSTLARSSSSTSTRARSTWRRNVWPRPAPLGRALDETGDVGEHELVVAEAHDTEVRLERRERVVGDLRLRRAHRRDQRGLPGVREADERGVGEQLHLEAEPALLAVLALLGEARRAACVRQEARVAPPAAAAVRGDVAVAVVHEVGEQLAVARAHDRALGHGDDEVVAARAVAASCPRRACPTARAGAGWSRKASSDATLRSAEEVHVAARAAVAAVGTALRACAPRAGTRPRPRRRHRRAR